MRHLLEQLKDYKTTKFMAKDSVYDEDAADYAVSFIILKVDGQESPLN